MTDPVELTADLIREHSVTPDASGALVLLAEKLRELGFETFIEVFDEHGPKVPNLYARRGSAAPNFCFAGHTDVVPIMRRDDWDSDPFEADIRDGVLYGRGAADMKGAIAAYVCAVEELLAQGEPAGSLSLLLTGDEEGPGLDGTKRMLKWLEEKGEQLDLCLVGEPTNPDHLGEMLKIGRRGSLHGIITAHGKPGHVAYPHRADNPIPKLVEIVAALTADPIDDGNQHFQPTNLEVLDLRVGNDADNVIPADARARFNVRFNNLHTPESLMSLIEARCARPGHDFDIDFRLSGDAFLTPPGTLSLAVQEAVEKVTGHKPELSTSGGTSDARFIKDVCPVVEFGLVGATMHKANEQAAVSDIRQLSEIYLAVLQALVPAR
jgi:succinyl-diaminopimelate desuccinylase